MYATIVKRSFGKSEKLPELINVLYPGDRGREEVETFIENVYRAHYGNHPGTHYPELIFCRGSTRKIISACGLRRASSGPLFLEQYLDGPIEGALAQLLRNQPERHSVFEVGGLAAIGSRALLSVIRAVAVYIKDQKAEYAVATATAQLRQLFAQFAIPTAVIGKADPRRVAGGGAAWGSYYDHAPLLLVGNVPDCLRLIDGDSASDQSNPP
jgi:Thermostable hemolysin